MSKCSGPDTYSQGRLFYIAGCHIPDTNFTFDGTLLEDGRVPENQYISLTCIDGKTYNSKCIASNISSSEGTWKPVPLCPNITCKWS